MVYCMHGCTGGGTGEDDGIGATRIYRDCTKAINENEEEKKKEERRTNSKTHGHGDDRDVYEALFEPLSSLQFSARARRFLYRYRSRSRRHQEHSCPTYINSDSSSSQGTAMATLTWAQPHLESII